MRNGDGPFLSEINGRSMGSEESQRGFSSAQIPKERSSTRKDSARPPKSGSKPRYKHVGEIPKNKADPDYIPIHSNGRPHTFSLGFIFNVFMPEPHKGARGPPRSTSRNQKEGAGS